MIYIHEHEDADVATPPALRRLLYINAAGQLSVMDSARNIARLAVGGEVGLVEFAPLLTIGNSSVGIVQAAQYGVSAISGGVCTIEGYLTLSSKGSLTGALNIAGLPVPGRNHAGLRPRVSISMLNYSTGVGDIFFGEISPGMQRIDLIFHSAGGRLQISEGILTDTTTMLFSATYIA